MPNTFTDVEDQLKRTALENLEAAQGELKLVAGDGIGDGERIEGTRAAIDRALFAVRLIQPAEAKAVLSTCEHCGSRCLDAARFPGQVFCNECEKTGSVSR